MNSACVGEEVIEPSLRVVPSYALETKALEMSRGSDAAVERKAHLIEPRKKATD